MHKNSALRSTPPIVLAPTSRWPLNKISAGAIASAFGVLVIYLLKTIGGIELPAEVQGAGAIVLFALVSYLVPIAPGEIAPKEPT
jgi:hypothetical protein